MTAVFVVYAKPWERGAELRLTSHDGAQVERLANAYTPVVLNTDSAAHVLHDVFWLPWNRAEVGQ